MLKFKTNRVSAVLAAASVTCFAATAVLAMRPIDTKGISIYNDYLRLDVQDDSDDSAYGAYMLKKNNDSKDTLTYSQFFTSFAEVSINGSVKLYSEGETVKAPYTDDNGAVIMVQDFGGVEITQRLSFTSGNSDNFDMLRIEYKTENKTDSDIKVSVRAVIDPTIADSESDNICVGDTAYSAETNFSGSSVPETWCIKGEADAITAYGITSDGSSAPDSFDVADWGNLYNERFDYAAGDSVSDNAAAVTWSDRTVKSGESFECGTKYGLFSGTTGSGSNDTKTGSPKTGDKGIYAAAGAGICFAGAAIVCRKRRTEEDE